jgi:hypothetical protein
MSVIFCGLLSPLGAADEAPVAAGAVAVVPVEVAADVVEVVAVVPLLLPHALIVATAAAAAR